MESAPTVQGSMLLIDPKSCSLYRQGPGMRGAGEGAAERKVPGAVKTAPYMAPVKGES